MRTIPRYHRESRKRDGEMRFQPAAPIRTMEECASALGMTVEQVKHAHELALQKLRAALSAWGYHKERA
jgi:hypothetical protein